MSQSRHRYSLSDLPRVRASWRAGWLGFLSAGVVLASLLVPAAAANATTDSLSITPLGWQVIGLDSNDVTTGPDQFPLGANVCNVTGSAVNDVTVTWNWGTANTYLSLDSAASKTVNSLAGGACKKLWWTVTVTRNTAAWNTTRTFTITASATGVTAVTTPAARQLYVEKLVSQNRNGVRSLTGPTNVVVGDTVTYVLDGFTATNGYEQLDAGPILDGSLFEITSISATYNKPTAATNDTYYADACGWDPVTSSGTYRSCIGPNGFTGGKAGGDPIQVSVTAKVIGAGTGNVGSVIYDFSGSSYHYNSDFSLRVVTSTAPAAPIAVDDSASTLSGVGVAINVPSNDTDADGDLDLTSVSVTGAASAGTTSVNATSGVVTYTPSTGFFGTDTFIYQICDSQPVCDTAVVTVTVTGHLPVAMDDSASTLTGVGVLINVPFNDTDADGDLDVTSVSVTGAASNGTTSVNALTGRITYTPTVGFVGTDSFVYRVCDSQPSCDTAIAVVTVTAPPVALDDAAPTTSGIPVVIPVAGNDSDLDGDLDVTSVSVTGAPSDGGTSVNPVTGAITYTPDAGFVGSDTFTYQICDLDSNCDTAIVTVTVSANPPVATDDSDSTDWATPVVIDVPSNDTDADGDLDLTSVTVTSGPSNGATSVDAVTGEITYTPDPGFTGTDTFTYQICDSQPACDTAVVTITVSAPGSAPSAPVATDDSDSTDWATPVVIDVPSNDTDADGDLDLTSVTVTSGPSNGATSVDAVTGEITYTPDPGFIGTDTFTYQICDSQPACDTAVVTITVSAPGSAPSAPVATDDSDSTDWATPVVIDVPSNDTDADGDLDLTSVTVTSGPSNGATSVDAVTGEITYTPDPGFTGTDTFTYQICDSQPACDTAVVTITVSAGPSPPVAGNNSATTTPGQPVVIFIEGNDSDPDGDLDPSSVTVVSGPAHGTLNWELLTLAFTYMPDPGYEGTDSFSYQICDLQSACSTALVTLAIAPAGSALGFTGVQPDRTALLGVLLLGLGVGLRLRRRPTVS